MKLDSNVPRLLLVYTRLDSTGDRDESPSDLGLGRRGDRLDGPAQSMRELNGLPPSP